MVFTHLESRPLAKPVHSVLEASLCKGGVKMQGQCKREGGVEVVMEYGGEQRQDESVGTERRGEG